METPRFSKILRERWYLVLIAALLGLLAALGVARSAAPNYAATATLFLRVDADESSLFERSQFSLARIKSYVDLVESPNVLSDTIDDLGLDITVDALRADVSASNPADTVLLRVTAEAEDPRTAALIANAVARNVARDIEELESAADDRYAVSLDLRIPADGASSTATSQTVLLLGLGLLSGLAVGVLVAALVVMLDPRVRAVDDVRRSSGLPVVGQIPRSLRRLRTGRAAPPDLQDALRAAFVDLRLLIGGADPRVLVLVPASHPMLVDPLRIGLARTLANAGLSVGVVTDAGEAEVDEAETEVKDTDVDEVELDIADVDGDTESEPQGPGPFERAAAAIGTGMRKLGRSLRPSPEPKFVEPFTVFELPQTGPEGGRRDEALQALTREISGEVDSVIVATRDDGDLPDVAILDTPSVLIVVDIRRTRRSRLRSITTSLEFAAVRPVGVILTSVPARRRVDLPSTWYETDRIPGAKSRSAGRPRRNSARSATGNGKASESANPGPALTPNDPTALTLDFGDQATATR